MVPKRNALLHLRRRPVQDDRHRQIQEIAYFKAMNRSFVSGSELTDWLEAEKEVEDLCRYVPEKGGGLDALTQSLELKS